MEGAAKFVDSLLRTVKTERENDKIIFFSSPSLHTAAAHKHLRSDVGPKKSLFESETKLFMENCIGTGSRGLRPLGRQHAAGALSLRGQLAVPRSSDVTAHSRGRT